jgi:hypothetical protein
VTRNALSRDHPVLAFPESRLYHAFLFFSFLPRDRAFTSSLFSCLLFALYLLSSLFAFQPLADKGPARAYYLFSTSRLPHKAYPGPDLCTVAAKVADQSRKKSRKVSEGRESLHYEEKRYHRFKVLRSRARILIKSRNVANQSRRKSRKVAQSRATSRATVATFRSRIGLSHPSLRFE